jgi:hypothetical protein
MTSYVEFMRWGNTTVEGWLGIGILISVFIITYYAGKQFENKRALLGAMLISVITATFLLYLELLVTAWWIGTVISFFLTWLVFFLQE